MEEARGTVERVARSSYGRLLAYLSSATRDVAAAEDALGEALVTALASWPIDGIPRQPEAWLLTAARRRFIDRIRSQRVRERHQDSLRHLLSDSVAAAEEGDGFPDRRVELLFVCAHPAIDATLRTPLMLQTVLGLDAARIAQAFLVPPATMGQRLVRAKRKIRAAGVPFAIPPPRELPLRLEAVLEAIYAAYGIGSDAAPGVDRVAEDLADEAIWLARVLRERLSDEPEVRGLLALMLFCDARRAARRGPGGRYIPLSEQDPAAWSVDAIQEAEAELGAASRMGRPGRFQLEAAIQSVHAERAQSGHTDWGAIVVFYRHLVRLAPTLGARVAQAAAEAEARGPADGLALLDEIDHHVAATYQPYWAVRAHLLSRLSRPAAAAEAYDRAIGLAVDPATRQFLLARRG
jgi:RNA polymerase sigma-70 factor (ECF subfamily)